MAVIEPITFADIEARILYCFISGISAMFVLSFYKSKDWKESFWRWTAAVVFCFVFVEPIAIKIRPYIEKNAIQDAVSLSAAGSAAVFIGVTSWFVVGWAVWLLRKPARFFGLLDVVRGKKTIQSFFVEDPGSAFETRTNGGSQGQPGIAETRTPSQSPTQTSTPAESTDGSAKSKTT